MLNKNNTVLLPTIVALALALRLAGIAHGFPFIFHVDEPAVVRTALSVRYFPNPGHFDWPHLYIYLNFIVYAAAVKLRSLVDFFSLKQYLFPYFSLLWNDNIFFYFLTRVFSAVLGAFTAVPLYFAARDTFGRRVGVLAALTLAVLPFHVWHSHYALIDVPMLFFASWAVYYALKIMKKGESGYYIGAGFYSGLAASTKYNGLLLAPTIPVAYLMRVVHNREKPLKINGVSKLLFSGLFCIFAFLIGTPYALLDFDTFIRTDGPKGALWQFTNVGSVDSDQRLSEFYNRMVYKVADDLGYTVLIGFFILGAVLVYRTLRKIYTEDDHMLWFIFVCGFLLLLYVSGVQRSRSQYYLVAYPFVIVGFAYIADLLARKAARLHTLLGFCVFFALYSLPSLSSVRSAYTFVQNDTRIVLLNWLRQNTGPTDTLYYNNSSLKAIVESLKNPSVKGIPKYKDSSSGYLILGVDNFNEQNFDSKIKVQLVANIQNKFRLGPQIQIFELNK